MHINKYFFSHLSEIIERFTSNKQPCKSKYKKTLPNSNALNQKIGDNELTFPRIPILTISRNISSNNSEQYYD